MATSIRCSMCDKGQGTCLCAGCKKYFCMKDFKSHRDTLLNEMDVIVGDRNDLQEKIHQASQHKVSSSPLLAQIDRWQNDTIEKVKNAAEQARRQVNKILSSKQIDITVQFETLSKELIERKDTEDFVEPDLAQLREKIQQLNQDLKLSNQPPVIELHTEQSDQIVWNRLIYAEEKSIANAKRPQSTINENWTDESLPKEENNVAAPATQKPFMCGGIRCSRCGKCRGHPSNASSIARAAHSIHHMDSDGRDRCRCPRS